VEVNPQSQSGASVTLLPRQRDRPPAILLPMQAMGADPSQDGTPQLQPAEDTLPQLPMEVATVS
jgi:hypothetical protein